MFDFSKVPITDYMRTPPQYVFDDIQKKSLAIWDKYDDTYGYASSKKRRVRMTVNISDNAWSIVAMFDNINQIILWENLAPQTQAYITRLTKLEGK